MSLIEREKHPCESDRMLDLIKYLKNRNEEVSKGNIYAFIEGGYCNNIATGDKDHPFTDFGCGCKKQDYPCNFHSILQYIDFLQNKKENK